MANTKKKILLGACPNSPRRPDTPRFTLRTLGNTASNPKKHRSGGDAVFALTRTDNQGWKYGMVRYASTLRYVPIFTQKYITFVRYMNNFCVRYVTLLRYLLLE